MLVHEKSTYNGLFEKSFEIDYVPDEKTLLIEYQLPSPDHMPTLKAARFVPATGEIRETHISERERKANFDGTCYQICLRRSEEHTSELPSLMRNSYAVFCLKKKKKAKSEP